MATTLYFHVTTDSTTGLPTAEQSALTADRNVSAQTVNRVMNKTIGTTQTSLTDTTLANTSLQTVYYTRFVSPPLYQSSIAANTWTYDFACQQNNASANFPVSSTGPVYVNCYVWRPSTTTKIGTILDGDTASEYAEPSSAATEKSNHGTFTGSAVTGLAAADVICFEVWFRITQASANSRTDVFYYDGTTENRSDNTTVSSYASFLETPENLVLTPINATVLVEWEEG